MIRESKFTANQFWIDILWKTKGINITPLLNGLTAYWAFENFLVDSTGNGSNLSNTNGTTQTAGKIGEGATFNGINQTLRAANNIFTHPTGDWTISFWVNSTDGTSPCLIDGANTATTIGVFISVLPSLQIEVEIYPGYNQDIGFVDTDPLTAGWHHVVTSYNSATKDLRVRFDNGTPVISPGAQNGSGYAHDTFNPLGLGATNDNIASEFLTGSMDEIGIWNRVLSSQEEDTLWNNGNGVSLA